MQRLLSFLICGNLFSSFLCFSDFQANIASPPSTDLMQGTPQQSITNDFHEILSLIENQIADIQANEISKAYDLYTSKQFKKKTSSNDFTYFINAYPGFSKNKNAFFGNIEHKPMGVLSIEGTLMSTNGDTMKVEYDFTKEDSQWKIIGIKVLQENTKNNSPTLPTPDSNKLQTNPSLDEGPIKLSPYAS